MIRHPFQIPTSVEFDTLVRHLLWAIAIGGAVLTAIIVVLAAMLLAATHAKAGECMTLREARNEGGYPKFRLHGRHKCWYAAGRHHKATSPRKVEVAMVGETKPIAIEVEMTRDEPAFAFADQFDPGNMVRAMVRKEVVQREIRADQQSGFADDTRPLSTMTASAGADDPVIVCDEFWRTECEPPSKHRQAVAWAIVALVVAFASVAVIVQAPVRRGLRGLREIGS